MTKSSKAAKTISMSKNLFWLLLAQLNGVQRERMQLCAVCSRVSAMKRKTGHVRRYISMAHILIHTQRSVLDPLAVSCDAWINRCQKHRLNDVLPDQDQQLLYYEKVIFLCIYSAYFLK